MKLAEWLAQMGVLPKEIRVRSELLLDLLNPLAKTLNIKCRRLEYLPSVDAAVDAMFGWMAGGKF